MFCLHGIRTYSASSSTITKLRCVLVCRLFQIWCFMWGPETIDRWRGSFTESQWATFTATSLLMSASHTLSVFKGSDWEQETHTHLDHCEMSGLRRTWCGSEVAAVSWWFSSMFPTSPTSMRPHCPIGKRKHGWICIPSTCLQSTCLLYPSSGGGGGGGGSHLVGTVSSPLIPRTVSARRPHPAADNLTLHSLKLTTHFCEFKARSHHESDFTFLFIMFSLTPQPQSSDSNILWEPV